MKRLGVIFAGLALLAALSTSAARQNGGDVPAPAPDKLEAITAFFDNEVATGKFPVRSSSCSSTAVRSI